MKRNHLRTGMTNSTASHRGSRAERNRFRQSIVPTHKKGSDTASNNRYSAGRCWGGKPSQGVARSKYLKTDQSSLNTARSNSRSRLYFTAKSTPAQIK